ncbi:MAG TPA: hypothetical protein VK105_08730 [Virgibacillus sp.]|nr:hypothetical protein [Virgibacillus sp.]HLR67203.1 hypothetical protein [Virgibacillus sp.]
MSRLPFKNSSKENTPLRKIVANTPEILDSFKQMDEAIAKELDSELMELTRVRVAVNNNCKYCKSLSLIDLDVRKRESILQNNESMDLSERENVALELVDHIMAYHGELSEILFQKLKKNFTNEEIIALLFQIGQKNAGGWFNIAMKIG